MSPILDLQQRLVEVGRIRMGAVAEFERQDGSKGTRPTKLATWRLTSSDKDRIISVATVYGGEVVPWEDQWEVVTETDWLPILVLPGQALSQWWEMWSGGGCKRRCDGHEEVISGQPCMCPVEYDERTAGASANPPTACKPTTRLSVLLPDIPGIGHWRLETHGFYAAVELAATAGLLQQATASGQLVPARLRIDPRSKVEGGRTTKWTVPVIDVDLRVGEMMPLLGAPVAAYTPLSAPPGTSLEQGLRSIEPAATGADSAPARANAAEPIPGSAPTGAVPDPPPPEPEAAPPPMDTVMISDAQRRLLFATATECDVDEARLRELIQLLTGQESTKGIPASQFETLLTGLQSLKPAPPPASEEPAADGAGGEPTRAAAAPQEPPEDASPVPPAAPNLDVVLPAEFQRYAGKTVREVAATDQLYLQWLSGPTILNAAVREAALYLITNPDA